MINLEKTIIDVKDILAKMEETQFLLKDGKQILAFNKLSGIKQKTYDLLKMLGEESEKNKNS
jgi:hypothetical protein